MAGPLLAGIPMVLGMLGNVQGLIPSLSRWSQYGINKLWSNQIPDAYVLLAMAWRKWITEDEFYKSMKKLGYEKYWAEGMYLATQERPSIYEYITLWRRGKLDNKSFEYEVEKLGVNEEMLEYFKQASEYFPNPSDLVRFAVREAYSPEIVKQYRTDEDYPTEFEENALKAGVPPEQCKYIWRSHWALPSTGQGYEMLQRAVISREELETLLRVQDIMPYWRDKLIQIAYRPYNRVDVRRMYRVGVLDEAGVLRSYLDLGYDEEKAQKMTDFTILYETDDMQGISRANIVNAYKKSIISREELIYYLGELGYNEAVIDFWVSIADYEKTSEELQDFKDDLIELFKLGDADIDSIRQQLYDKNLPAEYVNTLIQQLKDRKGVRRKVASKEDIDRWLQKKIITQADYMKKLRLLGYRDEDILNFMTEILLEDESEKMNFLGRATYEKWVEEGIMTMAEYRNTLASMGLLSQDIERLIRSLEQRMES